MKERPCGDFWSNASGAPLKLAGLLNGSPVFLIAGGPSLRKIDITLLDSPGVFTLGLNNSAKTVRPDLWVSVDIPSRFLQSIWLDPKILKFVRSEHRNETLFDSEAWIPLRRTAAQCPNVVFYESDLHYDPTDFLSRRSVSWGTDDDRGGRSVLLAALKILFHLGAGHVFLLGVDFHMTEETPYHFAHRCSPASLQGNRKSYRILARRLEELRPRFEAQGFHVWNCNPESRLETFPYCPFEEAFRYATASLPVSLKDEPTDGLYERAPAGTNTSTTVLASGFAATNTRPLRRIDRSKRPRLLPAPSLQSVPEPSAEEGVLLLGDAEQEWLLPWWLHHFSKTNANRRVALVDTGLTEESRSWLRKRNISILPLEEDLPLLRSTWFYKPFAIRCSPFEHTVFCDLDCEIRGDISPLFAWSSIGVVLGNDLFPTGRYRKLFRERCYYNSGLIGLRKPSSLLELWCEETKSLHTTFRGDQEILNLVLYESEASVVEMPEHFHQLRLAGDHPEAVVMHWTGPAGKNYIRKRIRDLGIPPIS